MMRLTHYCGVCRRDTADEAKPFHRHIARYYGWQTDTMYLAMHDGTSQLLTACIEAQDPASQVIVDPSEPPAELGDIEATAPGLPTPAYQTRSPGDVAGASVDGGGAAFGTGSQPHGTRLRSSVT
mgnify:CR=1 FL=1